MFDADLKIRIWINKIVVSQKFDYVILFFILISSVYLVLDNPLNDPNGKLQHVLDKIDYSLTSVFIFEAFLKIFAFGFLLNGKQSYLRNYWNIIDFVIVFLSVCLNFIIPLLGLIYVPPWRQP